MSRDNDAATVCRIERALERLRLPLLRFEVADPGTESRYAKKFTSDPGRRDFRSWSSFEFGEPTAFRSMYDLSCGKPPDG